MLQGGFLWGGGSVDEVALLLELFDELAELFGEAVHGALEAGQQVERHDDGEADAGDCGQEVLFHAGHLLAGDGEGGGWSGECFDLDRADGRALVGGGEGAARHQGFLGDDALGPGLDSCLREVVFRVGQGERLRLGVVEQEFDFERAFHDGGSFQCVSGGHPARVTAAAARAGSGEGARRRGRESSGAASL